MGAVVVPLASAGVRVPVELAAVVDWLIGRGLAEVAARNGGVPSVPGLEGVRSGLRAAAASASGPVRSSVVPPDRGARWVSVGEAAFVMGVSPRQVRRLAAAGVLIARKAGRDWQVDADSAAGYGDRRRTWRAA